MPLSSFLLNMNTVFERFVGRYLREHAPSDVTVQSQHSRSDVYEMVASHRGWRSPGIRPDFVLRRLGVPFAVADAKYKELTTQPPSTSDLYQLTVYGLAYNMPEPRNVFLLHPQLDSAQAQQQPVVHFTPDTFGQRVTIRVVGVPVAQLVEKDTPRWWPFEEDIRA
jgi:5-methylcytosine-specific restriction endonuclease McrBC regulatory subunit McrC